MGDNEAGLGIGVPVIEVVQPTEHSAEEIFVCGLSEKDCIDRVGMIETKMSDAGLNLEGIYQKVAKLFLFNETVEKGADVSLESAVEKIKRWMVDEENARQNIYLPTEGVELEIPQEDREKFKIMMGWFGIKTIDEKDDLLDINLLEINDAPTYSAELQARLLHELTRSGIIDMEEINDPKKFSKEKIEEDEVLSMHVNLGIPKEIDEYFADVVESA